MNFNKLIFISVICLTFLHCSSNSIDDVVAEDDMQDENRIVTYNGEIRAIMVANCTRCHGQPLTNGAPFPLVNFSQVSSRIGRIIARTNNTSNPMPPNGLIQLSDRQLIQMWEDDGLLEN